MGVIQHHFPENPSSHVVMAPVGGLPGRLVDPLSGAMLVGEGVCHGG